MAVHAHRSLMTKRKARFKKKKMGGEKRMALKEVTFLLGIYEGHDTKLLYSVIVSHVDAMR